MKLLHLIAGPNGAGKTTLYERFIRPETPIPFVNADEIAKAAAGGGPVTDEISADAAATAARQRDEQVAAGASFVAETVFSHPSKVDLVRETKAAGYDIRLHIVVVPVELSVLRVKVRVELGGHDVPENKIRGRHERLWAHVAEAMKLADETIVYDNSKADAPLRVIARFVGGHPDGPAPEWPPWTPEALRRIG